MGSEDGRTGQRTKWPGPPKRGGGGRRDNRDGTRRERKRTTAHEDRQALRNGTVTRPSSAAGRARACAVTLLTGVKATTVMTGGAAVTVRTMRTPRRRRGGVQRRENGAENEVAWTTQGGGGGRRDHRDGTRRARKGTRAHEDRQAQRNGAVTRPSSAAGRARA